MPAKTLEEIEQHEDWHQELIYLQDRKREVKNCDKTFVITTVLRKACCVLPLRTLDVGWRTHLLQLKQQSHLYSTSLYVKYSSTFAINRMVSNSVLTVLVNLYFPIRNMISSFFVASFFCYLSSHHTQAIQRWKASKHQERQTRIQSQEEAVEAERREKEYKSQAYRLR